MFTRTLADISLLPSRRWLLAAAIPLSAFGSDAAQSSDFPPAKCPSSGIVLVSHHDDIGFRNKPVRARLKGISDKDSVLRDVYPKLRVLMLPEKEIQLALERDVLDIAAYRCADLLRDSPSFFDRFENLNVWVLTRAGDGRIHLERTGTASSARPAPGSAAQTDKSAVRPLDDGRRPHPSALERTFDLGLNAYGHHDYQAAFKHFSEAAEAGYAPSQYALGVMYQRGQGVEESASRAAAWFEKAARQGHASAQFALAKAYLSGRGAPKDSKKGNSWLEKAAAQGHEGAKKLLKLESEQAALLKRQRELDAEIKKLCGGRMCEKLADGRYIYRTETYDPPLWYFQDGRLAPRETWPK